MNLLLSNSLKFQTLGSVCLRGRSRSSWWSSSAASWLWCFLLNSLLFCFYELVSLRKFCFVLSLKSKFPFEAIKRWKSHLSSITIHKYLQTFVLHSFFDQKWNQNPALMCFVFSCMLAFSLFLLHMCASYLQDHHHTW